MLTEYYFWFTQPSMVLAGFDWAYAYVFGGLFALSFIIWLTARFFITHSITKKLMGKFANAFFWLGVIGLIWFAMRYQNVPIFSRRVFAGSIVLLGVVWIGWVKWYMFFKFPSEKREYDYLQVKNKYIK